MPAEHVTRNGQTRVQIRNFLTLYYTKLYHLTTGSTSIAMHYMSRELQSPRARQVAAMCTRVP